MPEGPALEPTSFILIINELEQELVNPWFVLAADVRVTGECISQGFGAFYTLSARRGISPNTEGCQL